MEWIKGLLAAFQAINKLIDGAKALIAFYEKHKNEKWFQDYGAAVEEISKPEMSEEEAKRAFANYLRSLNRIK